MARYDTVHSGFRHGTTAALGQRMAQLVPGDPVACTPLYDCPDPGDGALIEALYTDTLPLHLLAAASAADLAEDLRQRVRPLPPRPDRTFQLLMDSGGYLTVTDGLLTAWVTEPVPGLTLFNGFGRPVPHSWVDPDRRRRGVHDDDDFGPPSRCQWCAAVRGGTVDQLRTDPGLWQSGHRRGRVPSTSAVPGLPTPGALRPHPARTGTVHPIHPS
jgi:hypothetical protein